MGNTKNKDEHVDIYFELDKPYYYAGDWIKGTVYLAVRQNRPYTMLYVRLECKQYCHWHEKHGKADVWFTGDRTPYENEFVLAKFAQGLNFGHYSFPFSIQIPLNAPGSYIEGGDTDFRIYFPLQAYLLDYNNPKEKQDYSYNITVVEPPRIAENNAVLEHSSNPKVCCCVDQGSSAISVRYRNTAVKGGTPIQFDVKVDNKLCKSRIKHVECELEKHLFVEANDGTIRDWSTSKSIMKTRPVEAGGEAVMELEMLAAVPSSTAIGSIVANYYTLRTEAVVEGCICCCGDNHPTVEKQIFIEAANPLPEEKKKMEPPLGWNPLVAPIVVYNGSNNFNYQRNPNLAVMNRPI